MNKTDFITAVGLYMSFVKKHGSEKIKCSLAKCNQGGETTICPLIAWENLSPSDQAKLADFVLGDFKDE
jgi:hypothetical protein